MKPTELFPLAVLTRAMAESSTECGEPMTIQEAEEILEADDDAPPSEYYRMLASFAAALARDPAFRQAASLANAPRGVEDSYARLLASSIHDVHFHDQPFELCDDLYGVLLQISNMVAGLVKGQDEYTMARHDHELLKLAAKRLENSLEEAKKTDTTADLAEAPGSYLQGLQDAAEALHLMAEEYFIPATHEEADKRQDEGETPTE